MIPEGPTDCSVGTEIGIATSISHLPPTLEIGSETGSETVISNSDYTQAITTGSATDTATGTEITDMVTAPTRQLVRIPLPQT